MGKFYSTKTYNNDRGLSCAFRQWRAEHSHCKLIHGYSLGFKVIFECDKLDERNWVMDFGGLKKFKNWLEDMFDHTLVIAEDDGTIRPKTIEELIDGSTGPRKKNYNTRWVASLVAETHRILERGGVFLYPGDDREGGSEGQLRKIYECGPIAFLVEQALGLATDGIDPILGSTAKSLHQRTPFVFGSKEEVETIKKFYEDPKSTHEPLFRTRGLFNR